MSRPLSSCSSLNLFVVESVHESRQDAFVEVLSSLEVDRIAPTASQDALVKELPNLLSDLTRLPQEESRNLLLNILHAPYACEFPLILCDGFPLFFFMRQELRVDHVDQGLPREFFLGLSPRKRGFLRESFGQAEFDEDFERPPVSFGISHASRSNVLFHC